MPCLSALDPKHRLLSPVWWFCDQMTSFNDMSREGSKGVWAACTCHPDDDDGASFKESNVLKARPTSQSSIPPVPTPPLERQTAFKGKAFHTPSAAETIYGMK